MRSRGSRMFEIKVFNPWSVSVSTPDSSWLPFTPLCTHTSEIMSICHVPATRDKAGPKAGI